MFVSILFTLNPALSAVSSPVNSKKLATTQIEENEHLVFFNTAASLNLQTSQWHIPIRGWIYEPQQSVVRKSIVSALLKSKYDLSTTNVTQAIFDRRVNLLLADNKARKLIVIRIAGREISLPVSKANGHFEAVLKLPATETNVYESQGLIKFTAKLSVTDKRVFRGEVKLVQATGVSIISDIDDTVKISHVIDHKKLFDYTFFKKFVAVPGMSDLYNSWSKNAISFHFVSSSPWHLYSPLEEFLNNKNFPWATLNLKMMRLKDKTILNIFKKGTETKPKQIIPILKRYPGRKFILVGDSGEQDPEVYAALLRKYQNQIIKVLIRNVTNATMDDKRFKKLFTGLSRNRWQLFTHPGEIATFTQY